MAVTAKFAADFTDFSSEVQKAEKDLKGLEVATTRTGAEVVKMSDYAKKSESGLSSMAKSAKQFDASLAAAGVNIGPVVRTIEEMGTVAGKTASQLGVLGTAGATLAAAIGGWQIGRKIAETFNTDKWIGDSVAKWMGWGDVAKEEAAAVADALAAASQRAGKPITDLNEAVRVNTAWLKEHKKEAKEDAEELKKWEAANQAVLVATQNHSAVLATINGQTVEAAKHAMALGVSQQQVATAYQLTNSEIAAIVATMKQEAEQLEIIKKKNEEVAAAIKQHWDGVGDVVDQVFGMDALKKATTWTDAIDALGGSVQNLRAKELEELNETMLAGIDALTRSGQLTSSQSSRFAELAIAAQQALAAMKPVVDTTNDLVKAQWEYALETDKTLAAAAEVPAATAPTTAAVEQLGHATRRTASGFREMTAAMGTAMEMQRGHYENQKNIIGAYTAAGIPISVSGVGGVNTGAFGGYAPKYPVNITINGTVLGNKEEIARVVGDAVTSHYRQGGNRLPA